MDSENENGFINISTNKTNWNHLNWFPKNEKSKEITDFGFFFKFSQIKK